ncbi:MAG: hypothetical protein KatS3mg118_2291 [Paracoccaceae bacterium]|nr:MAG: hypothetical protein KatS3mg118_2291 [Paracoccaceae bacterium]
MIWARSSSSRCSTPPNLSLPALGAALAVMAVLYGLNRAGVTRPWPYVLLGAVLWVAVLKSGVHATLAGVALGFLVPLRAGRDGVSLAESWEAGLHPWSSFLIMPLFAFANAGVYLGTLSLADLAQPVPMGIALGLFVGKQVGVFGTAFLAVRTGLAEKPDSIGWTKLYGASLLAGIGFTMSLFIGGLAYQGDDMQNHVRLGVIAGSLLSGICGAIALGLSRAPLVRPAARPG